jgi:hypothetical protein
MKIDLSKGPRFVTAPRWPGGCIVTDMGQVHEEAIRAKLIEMGWRPPVDEPADHKLNADQTVAVATDVFWNEDMSTCPRGAKVQLLGAGGVAVYGDYHGDPFWQAWAPLPKRRRK